MISVAFRQTMSRRSVAGLAAAIAASSLFVGPNQANAQSYTWGGAGSTTATTDYNLGTNWGAPPAGAPPVVAGQSAVFGSAGSATVSVSSGAITVDSWTFNAGAQAYTVSGGAVTFNTATGLVDNSANAVTIGNNLGGIGGVSNAGSGTLTLTGALSYSGITSATGGSIILGDATNAATLPGDATLNGGNLAVANGSLGAGTITVFGGSAIVVGLTPGLSATAGTATINNGGTLTFMNTGTAGAAQIANTGILDFADSATAANAAITTSGGGLAQFRDNATAANSSITIATGSSLTFGGNASGGSASLIINGGASLDISQTNAGIGTGSIAGAGDIFLGAKNLTVGGNNLSTPFSGVLQDGGTGGGTGGSLTKVGSGTLTLSGANTYTGATTINAGTLSVNGSIANSSGVTVNSGGVLGGTGTVAATVIRSGGALAPGNGIGTLAVSGNLTFNTGASYNISVSPAGASKASVSGTAVLAGTVNATYQPGNYVAKQYKILTAADTVTGTFAALNNTALPGNVGATLSYDLYNVYLNLTLKFDPSGGLNTNQQNVANALQDYFNRTGGIPGPFAALSANGLSQASGQAGTGPQQSGFAATGQFINAVFDNGFVDAGPSNTGFGNSGDPNTGFGNTGEPNTGFGNTGDPNTGFGNGGDPNTGFGNGGDPNTGFGNQGKPNTGFGRSSYAATPRLSYEAQQAYAALTPRVRASTFEARWRLWGAVYGGNATVNGDGATGSNTTTSRVYGLASGATYRISPATQLGFALGGAGSSFAIADGFGSGKADMFTAAVYARHAMGPAYVAAALGYTWQDASTERTVTIAGSDALHAAFHPQALTARLEGGRRYAGRAFGITPYAALQATSFFMPAYGEAATSGSSQFALSYASRTATATRAELGARWDRAVAVRGGVLTFKARTAWAHDWNTDRAATATFQTLPGATFTVYGAAPTADAALLSVGAQMAWARGWAVAANFDGEFSANSRSYAGKGSLSYAW